MEHHFINLGNLGNVTLVTVILCRYSRNALQNKFLNISVFFAVSNFLVFSSLLGRVSSNGKVNFGRCCLGHLHEVCPTLVLVVPIAMSLT